MKGDITNVYRKKRQTKPRYRQTSGTGTDSENRRDGSIPSVLEVRESNERAIHVYEKPDL